MNVTSNFNAAAARYQGAQSRQAPVENDLSALYGTDQVTIGESNRGLAEQMLLADCLGDAACSSMDGVCATFGMGTGGY